MATIGGNSLVPSLFPDLNEITGASGKARDRVLSYYESFQAKLKELMSMLTDDNKDLELDGYKIPAEQKNGAAGQYLVNNWLSEQEFIFSQLLDAYKFEQSLEQKLNNISFS